MHVPVWRDTNDAVGSPALSTQKVDLNCELNGLAVTGISAFEVKMLHVAVRW